MVMYPQQYRKIGVTKSQKQLRIAGAVTDYLVNLKNRIVAETEEVDPVEKVQLIRSVVTTTHFRSTLNIS